MAGRSSHSQNLFLTRALEKILSERELKRSQHQELRKACETTLNNEQLARSGTNCLENLAISVGKHFQPTTWDKVVQCAKDIFTASLPHQLLSWQPDESLMRFRGRTRPNLLRQETSSLTCALRVLYHMLADEEREGDYQLIEERLLSLATRALGYFILLSSEMHRDAWTPVMLLCLTRMIQLKEEQFKHHISVCYHQLCDLLTLDLKFEVRSLLRRVFVRIGQDFQIVPLSKNE